MFWKGISLGRRDSGGEIKNKKRTGDGGEGEEKEKKEKKKRGGRRKRRKEERESLFAGLIPEEGE